MDTALVSTKRAKKMEVHEKSAYIKYNLTRDQRQAVEDGYIYVHDMAFRRDTMNCFGRETRFITSEGVRSFYDFQDGQEIIVLTHKGNWKKAVVRSYGYQPMQIVGFKRAAGDIKEIRCTSNHRWILKDGTETCSLSVGDKLIKAPNVSDINWDIMNNSEKLLWCLGFGIGDGYVIKDNNIPTMHVRLCKSKIKYASRFEDCGYTVTFPKSLNGDGMVRMHNIHTKQLPFLTLSYENIKYFINGFLCADGHKSSNPNNEYCGIQVTGSLNDYLYDLLNVSGYYVTNISNLTNPKTNYGYRTSKTLSYGFHSNQADRTWFVKYIKPAYVNGREKVWCLKVEDDHSFILENGIPTGNCSLFNAQNVLTGGFEMGNIWYNEPKTLDVAFDVIGDIVLSAASQQYGGFTLYQVDEMLAPYAEKSYQSYLKKYLQLTDNTKKAEKMAYDDTITEMKQGFQGWEYKFNTVGSSRGDYPFITTTLGHGTQKWAPELAIASLETRMGGQGKKGFKKPVLFPKIVFLYDEALHGPGKELEKVFEAGVRCSAKTMYPDWLSLSGRGYIASMYQKYGEIVSPMGCVNGSEIVTYKYQGNLYVESFERMWNRLSDNFEVKHQVNSIHLYMDLTGIEIYDTEKGFVNTSRIIRNVSSDWMDVHFSNGRRLLCTVDHPFTTVDGINKRADQLTTEDKILINSSQYSDETVVFNEDKAWLLGLILCDGCYQNSHISVSINAVGEDEIEHKFHDVFPKYFNMETKTDEKCRGKKGHYKDLLAVADENKSMVKAIQYFTEKFGGITKINRHIPNEVFSWNYTSKMAFMAGMIDADGSVSKDSHGGSIIQIGSTNKELSLQQMALAQALGMSARLYHNHYNPDKPDAVRYRVEFYPTEDLMQFIVCEKKFSAYREAVSLHYATNASVLETIPIKKVDFSYDVTTDSEHFEVSGIYSHNCRAFLSPWYERGGMHPADENDKPVFKGRFNIGAISLNLPMILAKAKRDCQDFYEVLDYYLQMIREIHLQTYAYLGRMKASFNPLAFCEGGFYKGNLNPDDNIAPCLEPSTASFGITAFNELQRLYNGKSLAEEAQAYIERTGLVDSTEVKESYLKECFYDDLGYTYDKDQFGFVSNVKSGFFALDVLQYINQKIEQFKEEDGKLYAIYGTPAESLCFTGDTLVQTYLGDKRIDEIVSGDLVYSYNEKLNRIELKKVVTSKKTQKNAQIIEVLFDNGQTIKCTPNHPFAVRKCKKDSLSGKFNGRETIEWIPAGELKPGDRIKSHYIKKDNDGRYYCSSYSQEQNHKVVSIKYLDSLEDVYNIEVEDNHNYFVGGMNGLLVHNCGLQIRQFRKEFGIIEGVSDREYVSNSFHCHVSEDITPIEKQDYEGLFWEMANGGKIQYVRYPVNYNFGAIKSLIRRAMEKGFYEGVNLSLAYCDDCGHEELEMDVCPVCGSKNLTKIDRMNGYLAYSRVHGDTRLNAAKMAEIADRKSM